MEDDRDLNDNVGENQQRVDEFFRGKSVLITGATGFVGKVLVRLVPSLNPLFPHTTFRFSISSTVVLPRH